MFFQQAIEVSSENHVRHINTLPEQESVYIYELWAGRLRFDSRQRQEFSLLHRVQTGSGAHLASYPMDTGGEFLQSKSALGLKLTAACI
jgi:hypothetical protein